MSLLVICVTRVHSQFDLRPGLQFHFINRQLIEASYIHVPDRNCLLRIDKVGQLHNDDVEVSYDDRVSTISFNRCDLASSIGGVAKLVVLTFSNTVQMITLPKKDVCQSRRVITIPDLDTPWLMYTGLRNRYHLLWGISQNDYNSLSDNICDVEHIDVEGYSQVRLVCR